MADLQITTLERIELEHVDEKNAEDITRAAALAEETDLGAKYLSDTKVIGALSSISLAAITAYFGFSPPAAVISFIVEDIGDGGGNESLFSIIWSMCCAISILLLGRLSDKFGRRHFVMGAAVMSIVGAIIACTAKNMNTLIGANVLLGLAAGVQSSYALLAGEIVPNKYKWFGIALVLIPSYLPTGFGAYLGRMLVETANWRWIYYIEIILMSFALVLQYFFYKPPSFRQLHGGRTRWEELKRVDYVGIFLVVSGLSTFLLGVSWGGKPDPWTSPKIISLVVIGGCLIIALFFWDLYSGTPNPIIPVRVWKDLRGFTPLACIAGCAGAMYIAPVIIWPGQVNRLYGNNFQSWEPEAWMTTTIAFSLTTGMIVFGLLFHVIKYVKYQLLGQCIVATTFLVALASCDRNSMNAAIAFSIIGSFPVGCMEITPQVLIQMDSPDADIGVVYAFLHCFRTAAGAVFTAIFLAILNSKIPGAIESHVPPAALAAGLPSSSLPALNQAITNGTAAAMAAVPGMTDSIQVIVANSLSDAYASAYKYVYYSVVPLGVIAIISALALRDYDSRLTGHVPKKMFHGSERDGDVGSETTKGITEEREKDNSETHVEPNGQKELGH